MHLRLMHNLRVRNEQHLLASEDPVKTSSIPGPQVTYI